MSDWSAGYVTDIGYNYGYYAELNPLRLNLPFLQAGLAPASIGNACELGFGQGVSLNFHAAGSALSWWGSDFNPSQVLYARTLAAASGAPAHLFDLPFAEFCQRQDLPDFDFIALHGVWTWISEANRQVIVDFIDRKLNSGGVLYVSYYTLPSWVAMLPLRDLLLLYEQRLTPRSASWAQRIEESLGFAEQLLACQPAFAQANPQVASKLQTIRQNKNYAYLSHEYFNRDWQPITFSRMAEWLSPARLNYVCSAHPADNLYQERLSAAQVSFLAQISDPIVRETTLDLLVNRQYRRDYWVKGSRALSSAEALHLWQQQSLVLTVSADKLPQPTAQSNPSLPAACFVLLRLLADLQVHSIGSLLPTLRAAGLTLEQIQEAIHKLLANNFVQAAHSSENIAHARAMADRLNGLLLDWVQYSDTFGFLLSPVTGGGIALSKIERLFLSAIVQGHQEPREWARFADPCLNALGQRLVDAQGNTLLSSAQQVAQLTLLAEEFRLHKLPLCQALQIV
ncbi:class I SAM-dependent methyltransferase [Candidatus Magnetaquicoccus inordinatus]|uniref:class I SAM-dependent methyltransferase n=1 Tax=Candidatus Magnetaquicoccus inordinatus TaxID=2496818 RepID=UPI00102AB60E|nr:class I SAM-dependent methyltransferase [Candidatus Magnetaquicoccus inordinatus]